MQSLPNHRGPSRLIRVLLFPKLELLGRNVSNCYSWDSLIMALTPNIAVLNLKHLCHKQPGRKRCLQTRSSKLLEPFWLVNLANSFLNAGMQWLSVQPTFLTADTLNYNSRDGTGVSNSSTVGSAPCRCGGTLCRWARKQNTRAVELAHLNVMQTSLTLLATTVCAKTSH